ncbi:MAG: ATP-binding cassette domain-containing protein, partial [Chloroflexota bacterium]
MRPARPGARRDPRGHRHGHPRGTLLPGAPPLGPGGLRAVRAGLVRPPPRLSVRGVGLAYGAAEVLRDVSFELGAGERLAVVGPNGAGKSSLLRCLTGLAQG